MDLSFSGFDVHKNLKQITVLHVNERSELSNYWNLDEGLRQALSRLAKDPDTLDFVVDYCHRAKLLKSWGWRGPVIMEPARCPLRKADGSLRQPEELGLKSGGEKLILWLLDQAIYKRDIECIKHLRTFPLGSTLLTDEFLNDLFRKRFKDNKDSLEFFAEFILDTRIEDMTLQQYWDMLEHENVFSYDAPKSRVAQFYSCSLIMKCPDGFVSKILHVERASATNANLLISMLCADGIDCYPGYLLGFEGVLAAFDKKDMPRDYQGMIDTCLKRKSLPGYVGLLCGIPSEAIQSHKRCAEVLSLIHELTGSRQAVQLMDRKQRGRALMTDLSL